MVAKNVKIANVFKFLVKSLECQSSKVLCLAYNFWDVHGGPHKIITVTVQVSLLGLKYVVFYVGYLTGNNKTFCDMVVC